MLLLYSLLLCVVGVLALPTSPFLPEVFVGKCYEMNPTGVNCTQLWEAFQSAAELSNSVVNDADYAPFFALANFSTRPSGILFWSGNQAFALSISNQMGRYTTIEGTSTGYVLNGLSWCGTANDTFDYTNNCYYPSTPTYYGMQGVWSQGSMHFARGASGDITVLLQPAPLNYSDPDSPYLAYRNSSVFYQTELSNITVSQVSSITVLLLVNKTVAPNEMCGQGSLVDLQKRIQGIFNYSAKCIDEPEDIYHILCPPGSTSTPQCLAATIAYSEANKASERENAYLVWALVATVLAAAALVLTVYFALKIRARKSEYEIVK